MARLFHRILEGALGFKTGPHYPAIIADYPSKYTDTSPLNFDARISTGAVLTYAGSAGAPPALRYARLGGSLRTGRLQRGSRSRSKLAERAGRPRSHQGGQRGLQYAQI